VTSASCTDPRAADRGDPSLVGREHDPNARGRRFRGQALPRQDTISGRPQSQRSASPRGTSFRNAPKAWRTPGGSVQGRPGDRRAPHVPAEALLEPVVNRPEEPAPPSCSVYKRVTSVPDITAGRSP
jgi:hypothetical protein